MNGKSIVEEQKKLLDYLQLFESRIVQVEDENKELKTEINALKAVVYQDIKPYAEATFNPAQLESLSNLRLRILQLVSKLYENSNQPVSEQDVYHAFKTRFPEFPISNPASIGARMRELAFLPTYKRWYGQLLLRASAGRYFPNPNPPLKLLIAECDRTEDCGSCSSLPGCLKIALKGKKGQ